MAHEPADGALGLEGRHEFKGGEQMPPGAGNETSVFMYGRHRPDLGDAWLKIDGPIEGLHALGDADDSREAAEGRTGELFYPGEERGKSIVYPGRVVGMTLQAMRQQAADLRRVASECRRSELGSMTIVDPDDTGQGYALEQLRCTGFELGDEQLFDERRQPSPWQRKFILGLRAADPRAIWYPQESELANAAGATVVLTNEGNAPADLFILVRATGDPMDVVVENLTLGHQMIFDDLPMPAVNDRRLWINWTQRAIVRPDADEPDFTPNTDMTPYWDHLDSDWWDQGARGLGPGANSIKVSGTNVGTWDVFFHHSAE